jgi:crotonobetainyl-CoA:carnitine CoA-transferase CaiB-like acyl-CoA transferase
MQQALSGFTVLDFGRYIPGPYAAMLLAEQGAEVIKIEPPGGDPARGHPAFRVFNRSKRGLVLDLKKQAGREAAQALAAKADVLVQNFRPGAAERLGLGYEALRGLNPRLVYLAITGFGPAGPYRDIAGWEPLVGAVSGVHVEQGGRGSLPPAYIVLPLSSYYAAFMAAYAVTIALYAREKTGRGQRVDISLLGAILAASSGLMLNFEGQIRIPFTGSQGVSPIYRLYQGSDGQWFFLALGNLTFFAKFALLMERVDWLDDPLFEGAPFLILPPRNEQATAMIQEIFLTRTRDEWLEILKEADIPCAPAQPVETYMDDPQVEANEMVLSIEEPGLGRVRQMGVPVRLDTMPGRVLGRAPRLGEHSRDILSGLLGWGDDRIETLRKEGVI